MSTSQSDLAAQLAISVDGTGAEVGIDKTKKKIASLGPAAVQAGKEASAGLDQIGTSAGQASAKVQRSAANLIGSIQRTTAAVESGSRANSKYFETLAQQRGIDVNQLKPYLQALDEANVKAAAAAGAAGKGAAQLNAYGMSAKQTAAALRGVPAQLTDITVALQGGQAPLTVLLQQGGQLRDMFGGIVPAAKALGGAVLGLVNPLTLAAAGVLGLSVAYVKGSKEAEAFNLAIIASGNAAGVTAGQMQVMAENIDAIVGTQANAAEALAQMTAAGGVSAQNLEQFTIAAVRFEKVGGEAVSETAKKFADLRKAPLDAAVKLNEGVNFLTRSVYEQIKALQAQGQYAEAAAVAQRAFADSLDSRASRMAENLGTLEKGWRGIKSAIAETADALLSLGRGTGPEAQLAKTQVTIAQLESQIAGRNSRGQATGDLDARLAAAKAFVETQQETVRLGQRAAAEQARQVAATQALVDFDKLRENSLSNQEKRTREIARATELARISGASAVELARVVENINEKYKDTAGLERQRAQVQLELERIKNAAEEQVNAISSAEKVLEARRQAGLVSEGDYYAKKRSFLEEQSRVQEAAVLQEIALLERQQLTGKEKLENDRRIAEAEAKLNKQRLESATSLQVLGIQADQAGVRLQKFYTDATDAAQTYLDTLRRAQEIELGGMGAGAAARQRNAGRAQIEDRYSQQRQALDRSRRDSEFAGTFNSEAQAKYNFELDLIRNFREKALAEYDQYYARRRTQEDNWVVGASEATNNYLDMVRNTAAQTEAAFSSAFNGLEDVFVDFVRTGKTSFSSLADSIIADLIRIQTRQNITGPLASALGGLFSNTSDAGPVKPVFSAKGNVFDSPSLSAYSNGIYSTPQLFAFAKGAGVFGEAGPEAIMPLTRTPSGDLGVRAMGGGGSMPKVEVHLHESAGGGGQVSQSMDGDTMVIDVLVEQIGTKLAGDVARGQGALPSAMERTYGLNRKPGTY